MAKVLAILGSGRSKGYTASLLRAAADEVEAVEGVEVDWVHLHKYDIHPCRSCFSCIRNQGEGCVQDDDFGRKGEGILYKKVKEADGFLVGDAVHNWTMTAAYRIFIERLYPFIWTGELKGSHFASICSASNSGGHRTANRILCMESFHMCWRYVGGLPVHVMYMDQALEEARYLGRKLGLAARNGRQPVEEETLWSEYAPEVWNIYPEYMDNLTNGTNDYNDSLPEQALRHDLFHEPEALILLQEAADGLKEVIRLHKLGNQEQAQKRLVGVSACWVRATWKEFLQGKVIRADVPDAYRPLDQQD
jgi:multimeric flavodoxin WrbA